MYTQGLDSLGARLPPYDRGGARGAGAALPGESGCRGAHRAEGLDARRLPPDAHPADLPARAFRDRRHAAGGQLDHARTNPASQGRADGQGAGRRRPRHVPLQRRRDARHFARRAARAAAHRRGEVFEHLQLPDAHVGRHRCDRLAGRRRGDHEPDPDLQMLIRSVRARDGAHLQGRELSPAAGLRNHDDAGARHAGAAAHGAGRARPLVVAVADDVRPERRDLQAHRAVDALEDQALHQRRAAAAVRRYHRAAGGIPRPARAGSRPAVGRGEPALPFRRDRLDRVPARSCRATVRAIASASKRAAARTRAVAGFAKRRWRTRRSTRARERRLHENDAQHRISGRCTKSSFARARAWSTSTSAAFTPRTRRWRSSMRATCTRAGRKA